jgi:hypothetical protein
VSYWPPPAAGALESAEFAFEEAKSLELEKLREPDSATEKAGSPNETVDARCALAVPSPIRIATPNDPIRHDDNRRRIDMSDLFVRASEQCTLVIKAVFRGSVFEL